MTNVLQNGLQKKFLRKLNDPSGIFDMQCHFKAISKMQYRFEKDVFLLHQVPVDL